MSASLAENTLVSPWDAIADSYDSVFTDSLIGRAQRSAVQRQALETFRTGDHILELNCGTGADAVFLGSHGISVDAFDESARMAATAAAAVRARSLGHAIRVSVLPTENIGMLPGPYDGAFSNFSGLNCVRDLAGVVRELARLLRPGAPALLCFSTRICAWEVAWHMAHGNLSKAFRRLRMGGVTAELAPGAFVHVQYPTVRSLRETFAPHFRLCQVTGIGVAVPPSYIEHVARRHPRFLQAAEAFDARMACVPFLRVIGDHMLLRFEKRQP